MIKFKIISLANSPHTSNNIYIFRLIGIAEKLSYMYHKYDKAVIKPLKRCIKMPLMSGPAW